MAITWSRSKIAVLLSLAVLAGLLLLAQDQETLQIRSPIGAKEPGHAAYVAALLGADLTRGNRFDVLTNGDQIYPAMLDAIDKARRRVVLETYMYDGGEIAERFTSALEQAARRGVGCAVVVDAVGSRGIDDTHIHRLETAGCVFAIFNPPQWYKLEELNYRSHRRILVVDGEVGFTGGVGIADQWLGHAQDNEHWRDTQFRVRGPMARLLEAAFYENFSEVHGPASAVLDAPASGDDEAGHSLLVRSSPGGGSNDLKRLYLLALASARERVDITTPYFVTDESTGWSLEDAIARGVKIRILVEGDITDAKPVKYASRYSYDRLLQLGVELHEYTPTMLHTKTLVVDGIYCIFGSANFDNRSFELNDELNIAVSSPDLARRLEDDFAEDLKHAPTLTLAQWRKRPLLDKVREHFWSYFGEVF